MTTILFRVILPFDNTLIPLVYVTLCVELHVGILHCTPSPPLEPRPSIILRSALLVSYLAVGDLLNGTGSALDAHAVVLAGADFCVLLDVLSAIPLEDQTHQQRQAQQWRKQPWKGE